ncbi:MAG: hypothetical protein QG620_284 [Patescibacteria group bacterium]|nr:hypothetical protein [Patescibacteria group bacterium]
MGSEYQAKRKKHKDVNHLRSVITASQNEVKILEHRLKSLLLAPAEKVKVESRMYQLQNQVIPNFEGRLERRIRLP